MAQRSRVKGQGSKVKGQRTKVLLMRPLRPAAPRHAPSLPPPRRTCSAAPSGKSRPAPNPTVSPSERGTYSPSAARTPFRNVPLPGQQHENNYEQDSMQEQHCCENPVEKARPHPHPHPPRAQPRPRVAGRSRRPPRATQTTCSGSARRRPDRGRVAGKRRLRAGAGLQRAAQRHTAARHERPDVRALLKVDYLLRGRETIAAAHRART
jgi:hypothetical protein